MSLENYKPETFRNADTIFIWTKIVYTIYEGGKKIPPYILKFQDDVIFLIFFFLKRKIMSRKKMFSGKNL